MSNLIRGEFYKLRKSKYFIGMIFLSLVAGSLLIIQWDTDEKFKVSDLGLITGINSISYALEFIILTSFMFALLAGEFIAKDFKNNNINKCFSYGYTRSQIILSKLIIFIIFSVLLEVIYTTILVIYVSMKHGFCEVLNVATLLYLFRVIVVGIMYNIATICIIAMIAIITKSNFCTIVTPVIFIISISLAYSTMCPYISKIFVYFPYIIGEHAITRFGPEGDIIRAIISSTLTFIITIGGSLLYIKHEDIK